MPEPLLSLSIERDGACAVVAVSGEIDETTTDQLDAGCRVELDAGRSVLLDMDQIEFMASAGIAALVRLHTYASSLDRRFVVVRPSRVVRRLLELVQLDTILMDGA